MDHILEIFIFNDFFLDFSVTEIQWHGQLDQLDRPEVLDQNRLRPSIWRLKTRLVICESWKFRRSIRLDEESVCIVHHSSATFLQQIMFTINYDKQP